MGLFQIKAIKAQKMNIPYVKAQLTKVLNEQARINEREFTRTTATWHGEKPRFVSKIEYGANDVVILTGPTGSDLGVKKWYWLDEGTRPHVIRARLRPRLAFRQGGFKAKTTPGQMDSGGGARASGKMHFARQVMHPGMKARGWTKLLQRQRLKPFEDAIINATKIGADGIYR